MNAPFGLPVLGEPVQVSRQSLDLVTRGVAALWNRIATADAGANDRPLLLSYDVHPGPGGPVLIEANTNAGGIATALRATRDANPRCPAWEQAVLESRVVELFRKDLLGLDARRTIAIVDDNLAAQPLLPEMHSIAMLLRPFAADVRVVDAASLDYSDGRLRHAGTPIDGIYWRSTDFLIEQPRHERIRRAVRERSTLIAPSPAAYAAIADKRRLVEWSGDHVLARNQATGEAFSIARTEPVSTRTTEEWYAERANWVFKPASGYGSRGVYVGKSISRRKLAELTAGRYLAQRYVPHPLLRRGGGDWKYDLRFYADRGTIIGAAARIFRGQVVGMQSDGSGFAPVQFADSCCLAGALALAA